MKSIFSMILAAASALPLMAQQARLSVIHAIPGLPAPVEIVANGSVLLAFDYGTCKGPLVLPAATYNVEVRLRGQPVLSAPLSLQAGRDYTAIAHLTAGAGNTLTLFENDVSSIAAGNGRLVVRHVAAAPTVDVGVTRNGMAFVRFNGLANPDEVQADVPADSYRASIFPAGSSNAVFGPARLDAPANVVRIVYAIGSLAGSSFDLLIQDIDLNPERAQLTVIHGIPGLPAPVDVFADGSRLLSFDFRDARGPLFLEPRQYAIGVRLQGATVLSANPTLAPGRSYTAIAHLQVGGGIALALRENDFSTPNVGEARVTVRHLADAPAVDVLVEQNGRRIAVIPNLSNPNEATAALPAGRYDVSLLAAGSNNRVLGPVGLDLASRGFHGVQVVGSLSGKTFGLVVQDADLNEVSLIASVSGRSCGGTARVSTTAPDFGKAFRVSLAGATPRGVAMLMLGSSDRQLGNLSLPLDLGRYGAPGCTLYTSAEVVLPMALDANGNTGMIVKFPRSNARRVWSVYCQLASSSNANSLGSVYSELITVGAR